MQASPRVPGGGAEMEQDVRQKDADAHSLGWISYVMIKSQVYGARLNVASEVYKLPCFCSFHTIVCRISLGIHLSDNEMNSC